MLITLVVSLDNSPGQSPTTFKYDPAKAAQANLLLRQAQAAAGGEEALRGVTSLTATVRLRRFVNYVSIASSTKVREREKILAGKIRIELQLPDKFLKRVSTTTLTGNEYSYVEVVDGNRAWRDPPLRAASSNRDPRVVDVSDFERSLAYQAQSARQQLIFYSLIWLIRGAPDHSLRFNSQGWLQTEGERADVISVYGPDNYETWLLLDQKTHLPTGMLGSIVAARAVPVVVEGIFLGGGNRWEELMRRARQERQARMKPPQRLRVEQHFSDYRRVGAILLPHRLTTTVDEKLVEELLISSFRINPKPDPRHFEPRLEKKPRKR
jgi:hypothetical protein